MRKVCVIGGEHRRYFSSDECYNFHWIVFVSSFMSSITFDFRCCHWCSKIGSLKHDFSYLVQPMLVVRAATFFLRNGELILCCVFIVKFFFYLVTNTNGDVSIYWFKNELKYHIISSYMRQNSKKTFEFGAILNFLMGIRSEENRVLHPDRRLAPTFSFPN